MEIHSTNRDLSLHRTGISSILSDPMSSPSDRKDTKRRRTASAHPSPGTLARNRRMSSQSEFEKNQRVEWADDKNFYYLGRVVTGLLEPGDELAVYFEREGVLRVKASRCFAARDGASHDGIHRKRAVERSAMEYALAKAQRTQERETLEHARAARASSVLCAMRTYSVAVALCHLMSAARRTRAEHRHSRLVDSLSLRLWQVRFALHFGRRWMQLARERRRSRLVNSLMHALWRVRIAVHFGRCWLGWMRAMKFARAHLTSNVQRARKRAAINRITAEAARATAAMRRLAIAARTLQPLARQHFIPGEVSTRVDPLRIKDEEALLKELSEIGSSFGKVLHPIVHDRSTALQGAADDRDEKKSDKPEPLIDPLRYAAELAALPSMEPLLVLLHSAVAPAGSMHLSAREAVRPQRHSKKQSGYGRRLLQSLACLDAMMRRAKNPNDLHPMHADISQVLEPVVTSKVLQSLMIFIQCTPTFRRC